MPTLAATFSIPPITDERLAQLVTRIRPVVRGGSNALHWIKPCDPRGEAFTWDPKRLGRAQNLVKHATIRTLHTYGYYGMFKPSIAEVLAQIPEALLEQTVAFETTGPRDAAALNDDSAALNAGFHVATTVLYGRSA